MCGACGGGGGTRDWYTDGVEDTPSARKRAQLELVAWASRLFGPDRIRVHEVPGTTRVMVVGPTGRGVVAQGVDEVLDAVDRVGAGGVDWMAVVGRVHATVPSDATDWAYRSLALAVAGRQGPVT